MTLEVFATTNGVAVNIAQEVRLEAIRQGIKVQDLADRANLKRPYFSIRLNGHRDFTAGELVAIGEALGVPAWELMRRAGENAGRSQAPVTEAEAVAS